MTAMAVAIIKGIWYLSMIKDLAVNLILELKYDRYQMVQEVLIFFSCLNAALTQRQYSLIIRISEVATEKGIDCGRYIKYP